MPSSVSTETSTSRIVAWLRPRAQAGWNGAGSFNSTTRLCTRVICIGLAPSQRILPGALQAETFKLSVSGRGLQQTPCGAAWIDAPGDAVGHRVQRQHHQHDRHARTDAEPGIATDIGPRLLQHQAERWRRRLHAEAEEAQAGL